MQPGSVWHTGMMFLATAALGSRTMDAAQRSRGGRYLGDHPFRPFHPITSGGQ